MEGGQVLLDSLPDDFHVHFEVAVGHGIAHLVGEGQRQVGVCQGEIRIVGFDAMAGFADDFQVAQYCVLDQLVLEKRGCGQP